MAWIIISWCLISCTALNAQQLAHVQGEFLVRLKENQSESAQSSLRDRWPFDTPLGRVSKISDPLDIWLFRFDFSQVDENTALSWLRVQEEVQTAQFNHLLSSRKYPDDPLFSDQWCFYNTGYTGKSDADIDAELAWNYTTGGLTANGDTIVIAVLDDGIDLKHPDLKNNLWKNKGEIPGNGVDDDYNGYVDDFHGWNILAGNDSVQSRPFESHGTKVCGIIGAEGNNGQGTSGLNWQVQMMIIKNNFNTDEAAVIEAYTYPLIMRRLYNQTNGERGAFVVATNASWGLDLGRAADAPLWCSVFDSLGMEGVINVAATSNLPINVDLLGDLP